MTSEQSEMEEIVDTNSLAKAIMFGQLAQSAIGNAY